MQPNLYHAEFKFKWNVQININELLSLYKISWAALLKRRVIDWLCGKG
jgi:hypothetical protein